MFRGYFFDDLVWVTLPGLTNGACYGLPKTAMTTIEPYLHWTHDNIQVHNAYHITWQESDIPSLTPQPPKLCGEGIATWVPGGDPDESDSCSPHSGDSSDPTSHDGMDATAYYCLVTIIPGIVGCIILYTIVMCVHYSAKEKQNAARALQGLPPV